MKKRVLEGGHNIPVNTIIRRYYSGLKNLVNLYSQHVDYFLVIDNSKAELELIAEKHGEDGIEVHNEKQWLQIKNATVYDK